MRFCGISVRRRPRPGGHAAAAAYNSTMFPDLNALLAPAVVARLTLLANHVLASEPQATRRLLPHQGRIVRLEFEGWPTWLPAPSGC